MTRTRKGLQPNSVTRAAMAELEAGKGTRCKDTAELMQKLNEPEKTVHRSSGWIGVDLDGTLAEYHDWPADGSIGEPIPAMVERVKHWLAEGREVKIFTARVCRVGRSNTEALEQEAKINAWCLKYIGVDLATTCIKDSHMIELWDDRARQVEPNTGREIKDLWIYAIYPDRMVRVTDNTISFMQETIQFAASLLHYKRKQDQNRMSLKQQQYLAGLRKLSEKWNPFGIE